MFKGEHSVRLMFTVLPIRPDRDCKIILGYQAGIMLCAGFLDVSHSKSFKRHLLKMFAIEFYFKMKIVA